MSLVGPYHPWLLLICACSSRSNTRQEVEKKTPPKHQAASRSLVGFAVATEAYRGSLPLATSSVVSRSSTLPTKGRLLGIRCEPEPLLDAVVNVENNVEFVNAP